MSNPNTRKPTKRQERIMNMAAIAVLVLTAWLFYLGLKRNGTVDQTTDGDLANARNFLGETVSVDQLKGYEIDHVR